MSATPATARSSTDAGAREIAEPRPAALARSVPELVLWFAAFALLFTRSSRLYDSDSYFHLAVARLYSEHGIVSSLPWARLSVMHDGYGDKELLFHLLLVPFARLRDPELGGMLALACLNALLAVSLGRIATAALGAWGRLVPLLVLGTSGTFALRMLRLRPELLSLLLLLWVIWAVARRRVLLAAVLSAAFALAHTAFHSLLGLCFAWSLWTLWAERRLELRMPLAIASGIAAGLLVHPHFPQNIAIWWVQNVDFFRYKAELDVGNEIEPYSTASLLQLDAPWLLALLCVWAARRPADGSELARRTAPLLGIAALAYGLLFTQMGRFATYFVPLATLALAFELRARGHLPGSRMRLPGGRNLNSALALCVVCALGLLNVGGTIYVNMRAIGGLSRVRGDELRALARAIPRGAHVAAHWADAEDYAFFAPWGRYLNVLDPVFLRVAHPQLHQLWTRILHGDEPDTPLELVAGLESDYIAFGQKGREALDRRLLNDPRMKLLQRRGQRLFRVRRDGNRGFVTTWAVSSDKGARDTSVRPYPALVRAWLRNIDGYVDGARIGQHECMRYVHERETPQAVTRFFELAPWGATALAVDGKKVAELAAPQHARLGEGIGLTLELTPGHHRFVVRTCPDAGRAGFYLLDRSEP